MGQMALFRKDVHKGWEDLRRLTSASHKWLVLAVVLVGAALRMARLWEGITYDEAFSATFYAVKPASFILSDYTWPGNHLLHTLLTKLSMALFGTRLWSSRLPALLAGVLAMPLYYLFARQMFNRYVAVLALAFVAASGVLIEYSALARGYSIGWLFMVAAWVAGRHVAKRNNAVSAALVAVFCALGLWAVPTMLPAALGVYFWLLFYLMSLYRSSLNRRLLGLLLSFALFVLLSVLVYAPVIATHGLGHLLQHPATGDRGWAEFARTHQDKAAALWVFLNDASTTWVSVLVFAGVAFAAYISVKYRIMLIALVAGSVPLVLLRAWVGSPEGWAFILFNVHLGSGLALFYLLKFVQENVYAGFTKRFRTVLAAALVLAGMGWLGMTMPADRIERFDDAPKAAAWFKDVLHPGDLIRVSAPEDAPFKFHLMAQDIDPAYVNPPVGTGRSYVLVSPAEGQTVGSVLMGSGGTAGRYAAADSTAMQMVMDWRRLEIWKKP